MYLELVRYKIKLSSTNGPILLMALCIGVFFIQRDSRLIIVSILLTIEAAAVLLCAWSSISAVWASSGYGCQYCSWSADQGKRNVELAAVEHRWFVQLFLKHAKLVASPVYCYNQRLLSMPVTDVWKLVLCGSEREAGLFLICFKCISCADVIASQSLCRLGFERWIALGFKWAF